MDLNVTVGGRQVDSVRGGLAILLLGLCVAGYGGYDYAQQSGALEDAVEVEATVTEAGVEAVGGSSSGTKYEPRVSYQYTYAGTTYEDDDVFPSEVTPTYDTEAAARSVVEDYEEGDVVTAYVHPDAPGDAYLERRISNAPLVLVALGALFVLGGGVVALSAARDAGPIAGAVD